MHSTSSSSRLCVQVPVQELAIQAAVQMVDPASENLQTASVMLPVKFLKTVAMMPQSFAQAPQRTSCVSD